MSSTEPLCLLQQCLHLRTTEFVHWDRIYFVVLEMNIHIPFCLAQLILHYYYCTVLCIPLIKLDFCGILVVRN